MRNSMFRCAVLSAVTVVVLCLAGNAVFADTVAKIQRNGDVNIEVTAYDDNDAEIGTLNVGNSSKDLDKKPAYYKVTYSDENIRKDGMYMIFNIKSDDIESVEQIDAATLQINGQTINYLDQVTASEDGKVTFNKVYPSQVMDSLFVVTGTNISGMKIIAYVDAIGNLNVVRGDVNGDGRANTADATKILRYVARLETLSDDQLKAGDVTGDDRTNTADVTKILRFVARYITEL